MAATAVASQSPRWLVAQPYRQLADLERRTGDESAATQVLIQMEKNAARTRRSRVARVAVGSGVLQYTIGLWIRLLASTLLDLGIVGAGSYSFQTRIPQWSCHTARRSRIRLFYSEQAPSSELSDIQRACIFTRQLPADNQSPSERLLAS